MWGVVSTACELLLSLFLCFVTYLGMILTHSNFLLVSNLLFVYDPDTLKHSTCIWSWHLPANPDTFLLVYDPDTLKLSTCVWSWHLPADPDTFLLVYDPAHSNFHPNLAKGLLTLVAIPALSPSPSSSDNAASILMPPLVLSKSRPDVQSRHLYKLACAPTCSPNVLSVVSCRASVLLANSRVWARPGHNGKMHKNTFCFCKSSVTSQVCGRGPA
jgi:hypothetical protein